MERMDVKENGEDRGSFMRISIYWGFIGYKNIVSYWGKR